MSSVSARNSQVGQIHQEPEQRHGMDSPLEPPEGANPADTLPLDF